ncbi:MAG TPA: hypothetical protein VFO10_18140 [Oligoflexus sp.]|uniref:hypothetical protein n=1 Tax=Oligoflexus sp. TaxID=1971216 RepID=UPI002D7F571B|nr:hypothetical protein [Oligoflexus sp.]HET9239186.1 hypothetical protein [Oligoflexus sp.]
MESDSDLCAHKKIISMDKGHSGAAPFRANTSFFQNGCHAPEPPHFDLCDQEKHQLSKSKHSNAKKQKGIQGQHRPVAGHDPHSNFLIDCFVAYLLRGEEHLALADKRPHALRARATANVIST